MAKITKVPNGPLIKKKGEFKGSTLKSGGKVKKAMLGAIMSMAGGKDNPIYKKSTEARGMIGKAMGIPGKPVVKNGNRIKKAQVGEKVIKGSRPGMGVFRTTKERTTSGGLLAPYKYKTESIDTTGYSKGKSNYRLKTEEGEGDKTGSKVKSSKSKTVSKKQVPSILKSLSKAKDGNMLKRDDGSYSKRGLWDNIRANKGSGKKPTAAMLKQERKIKAKK